MKIIKEKSIIAFLLSFLMLFNLGITTANAFEGFREYEVNKSQATVDFQVTEDSSGRKTVTFVPVTEEDELEIKRSIEEKQKQLKEENVDEEKILEYRMRSFAEPKNSGIDYSSYKTKVIVDVETSTDDINGFPWDLSFPEGFDLTVSTYENVTIVEQQTVKVTAPGKVEFPNEMRVYSDTGEKRVFSISVPRFVDLNPIIEQIYTAGNYSDGTKVFTMKATFVQIISSEFTTKWYSTKDESTFPNLRGTFKPGQGTFEFNLPKNGQSTVLRNDIGDQKLIDTDILSLTQAPDTIFKLGVVGIEDNKIKDGEGSEYFVETAYNKLTGGVFSFYQVMTITLDAGEGTVNPDKVEVGYTKAAGELPTPTAPTGKTFVKWKYADGTDYDPTKAVMSDITVTAEYTGKPFNPDNVVGMKITTPPNKVDYKVGEKFDPTGMKVTLTDGEGITKVVPYEDFAANNLSVPTDKALELTDEAVTVTYEKGITKLTDEQPITVSEHEFDPDNVVKMKITTPPNKVNYIEGEKFDPTGMKVTLTDKNGITKVVPYEDFEANNLSVPTDKALELTDEAVTVTYEKGNTKLTDEQPITVSEHEFDPDNVVKMKITTPPNKVNYIEGEKFDPTGMKVTLTDKNGITKVVPYADFAANNLSVPTDKALELTDEAVTVTYEKGNTKLTDDQPITVRKATVEEVTIKFLPGAHGRLVGITEIKVAKGTPFSEVRAKMPTVVADTGWRHLGWNPTLPANNALVNGDATYTATYELSENVIPVDPTDPVTPGYVRVRFLPGYYGRLVGHTHFDVRIGTPFSEVRAKMPTVVAIGRYYHSGWSPNLPSNNTRVTAAATYTALYRSYSDGDGGHIPWPGPSPSPSYTVVTKPLAKPTLIKDDHFAYIKGYPNGNFRPEAAITRGEVAAIFARLVKGGITGIESGITAFTDVKRTDWYHDSIAYLAKHKIIEGYPDGSFKPEKEITRAEFSAIVSRFSELSGGNSNFTDVPGSHWAKKYIDFAYSKGWITGYPDGTFKPERNITRAEAVTIVNKVLDRSADKNFIQNNLGQVRTFKDLTESHWAYYNILEAANSHDYTRNTDGSETWTRVRN